jgi:hypothetical protein
LRFRDYWTLFYLGRYAIEVTAEMPARATAAPAGAIGKIAALGPTLEK